MSTLAVRRAAGALLVIVPLGIGEGMAEVWALGYLLVRGVRSSHQNARTDTSQMPPVSVRATG